MTLEATGAMVVPFGVGSTDLLIETIRQVGINAIFLHALLSPAVLEKALGEHFPNLDPRANLGLRLGLFVRREAGP